MDIDICGPSIPKMMGVENEEMTRAGDGWGPIYVSENLSVMSISYLLENKDEPVIWRGPRKNGMIQSFLSEVIWE